MIPCRNCRCAAVWDDARSVNAIADGSCQIIRNEAGGAEKNEDQGPQSNPERPEIDHQEKTVTEDCGEKGTKTTVRTNGGGAGRGYHHRRG